jgi:hypothetical protein
VEYCQNASLYEIIEDTSVATEKPQYPPGSEGRLKQTLKDIEKCQVVFETRSHTYLMCTYPELTVLT